MIINDIESVIIILKNLPKNKSLRTNGLTCEFYQTFKEESILICLNYSKKTEEEGMLLNSFCGANIILIPKSDKGHTQKKNISGQYN